MTKRKAATSIDSGNDSNLSPGAQENSAKVNSNHISTQDNQNVQNRPAVARARIQQPNDESDGGTQGKCKKERADNWSNAEIQVLHQGIESRRDIFYGPQSQATKKSREQAWESITKDINAVSSTPRSVSQVMKKFKNEKCRAKRKFMNPDKIGHQIGINNTDNGGNNNNNSNNSNNIGGNNNNSSNSANNNINLISQSQSQQHPQQSHLMTNSDSMSQQQTSINVVKIAPQNVAKAMIDLPGHVQQIQMPSDDMVLIVPEMDGLLSGMNIVSDALNNQPHGHHGQHAIQAINTGQGLVNGSIGNSMMTRTLQTGSMCSLVYSTGGEVCGSEQQPQLPNSMATNQHPSNHMSVAGPSIMHHRNPIEQSQGQQSQSQHQQHQPQHHQQMHPHHQPQQPSHQQLQQTHTHQSHPTGERVQHHGHQSGHTPNQSALASTVTHQTGGIIATETQLKNLLFDVLLKDGQSPILNQAHENSKQRNDILTVIANSLNKIEDHLGKISMIATNFLTQHMSRPADSNPNVINNTNQMGASGVNLNLNGGDVSSNDVNNINRTSSSNTELQRD